VAIKPEKTKNARGEGDKKRVTKKRRKKGQNRGAERGEKEKPRRAENKKMTEPN
jgi:hypothetical protein